MDSVSHGSSRYAVEYDAFGQVIVSEGEGKYSLRSRSSAGGVSKSVHAPDNARSLDGADHARQANGAGLSHAYSDPTETPQPNGSAHYRRRSNAVGDEATATIVSDGATVSTATSSLLRRIGRRNKRREDSVSDGGSTTRRSDFSRSGGRRKNRRKKKKHKGRSIDKHSDPLTPRRHSASDIYDVGGPDNNYWREMVAEHRSSLDAAARRRRGSTSSSPRRRLGSDDSQGNRFSVRPPRVNSTSPVPSVGTGSVNQFGGSVSVRRSGRRQSSSTSTVDRDCCGAFPTFMFIVIGCLLVIVGVIRIFISFWHEFGSSVWTGALVSKLILYVLTQMTLTAITKAASREAGCLLLAQSYTTIASYTQSSSPSFICQTRNCICDHYTDAID